jgi:hypothetical protein
LRVRSELWGRLFALRIRFIPIPAFRGFRLFANWIHGTDWKQKLRSVASTWTRVKRRSLNRRVPMIPAAQSTSTSVEKTPGA